MTTRTMVPTEKRVHHAAEIFGSYFSYPVEPTIYTVADRLSADYQGGYWAFWALDNQGFYMAPDVEQTFAVICENGFEGSLSADAFGITCCLYTYSDLSFQKDRGLACRCAEQYQRLRVYVYDHPEAEGILRATD